MYLFIEFREFSSVSGVVACGKFPDSDVTMSYWFCVNTVYMNSFDVVVGYLWCKVMI